MAANPEITLEVHDNAKQQQAEEEAANNPDSETIPLSSRPRVANNTTVRPTNVKSLVLIFSAIMKNTTVRLLFHWISSHWKKIFVISCVFGVLLDPLFLYIPIINHDIKCLRMDKKLNKTAISLRSITDFSYLVDIILQVYTSVARNPSLATEIIWRSYILIDILAILPLPQTEGGSIENPKWAKVPRELLNVCHGFNNVSLYCVQIVILVFFTKARGWISLVTNCLVLQQYVPRVLRIYFSCKELKETPQEEIGLWVKGVFNFFLYILASHVLGALWYFFGIQQMKTCWHNACRIENGCKLSTFDCDNQFRNSTLLNDLCPINPPIATIFDFGIFLQVLQNDISGSRNHPQKFANCFWWGLRNLSSLGSNLEVSINTWENLFAASISVIGLLLFLYLIGNLQAYMQLDSARREEHKHKMKIEKRLEEKVSEIEQWLSKNYPFIPVNSKEDVMSQIKRKVKQELEGNREVYMEDIPSILPSELQSYTMLDKLRTVPKLKHMDIVVLEAICENLKPKSYAANSYIIQEQEPLEMMLLIMDGVVTVESSSNASASTTRKTGDLCGEELLDWATDPLFPTILPFSTIRIQAMNNVKARVLMASDLGTIVILFWEHFSKSVFTPQSDDVRFNRLGLVNLHLLRSALHIESV